MIVAYFRICLPLLLVSLSTAYPRSLKPKINHPYKLVKHGHPWLHTLPTFGGQTWGQTLPVYDKAHFMSKLKTLMVLKHMATKNPKLSPILAATPRASIPAAMDVFNSAVNDLTEIAQSAIPNIGSISPTYNTINNMLSGEGDRSSLLQDGADMVRNIVEASGGHLGIAAAMGTMNNANTNIRGLDTNTNNKGIHNVKSVSNKGLQAVAQTSLSDGGHLIDTKMSNTNYTNGISNIDLIGLNTNKDQMTGLLKPELSFNIDGQTTLNGITNNKNLVDINGLFKPKSFGTSLSVPFETDTGGIPVSTNMIKDSSLASTDTHSSMSLSDTSPGLRDQTIGVSHDLVVKPIDASPNFIVQPISAEFPISQIGSMDISLRDFQSTSLVKDVSNPLEVRATTSGKSKSNSHPKIKVYNPFTNRLQPEAFGPGPYHECTPPSRVVCGSRIDWNHVIGMTSWCKKNCVVFNYSSYCDDNRCQCKCETAQPNMKIQ